MAERENRIVCYVKSVYQKKILVQEAEKHPFCNSTSSYAGMWLSLAVKYIKEGVNPESILAKFDESVKFFKNKDDFEE